MDSSENLKKTLQDLARTGKCFRNQCEGSCPMHGYNFGIFICGAQRVAPIATILYTIKERSRELLVELYGEEALFEALL